jgi:hypothetical protein
MYGRTRTVKRSIQTSLQNLSWRNWKKRIRKHGKSRENGDYDCNGEQHARDDAEWNFKAVKKKLKRQMEIVKVNPLNVFISITGGKQKKKKITK